MIVVEGVGIGVIFVMGLVQLMEEIHKEIMSLKLVMNVTEMATEDVMFVMAQEKINSPSSIPYRLYDKTKYYNL